MMKKMLKDKIKINQISINQEFPILNKKKMVIMMMITELMMNIKYKMMLNMYLTQVNFPNQTKTTMKAKLKTILLMTQTLVNLKKNNLKNKNNKLKKHMKNILSSRYVI